jgi:hypothetical protein
MRVKYSYDESAGNERRLADVELCPLARGDTSNRELSGCGIHVNPTSFFVPLSRVVSRGIYPGLLYRLLYDRIVQ